MSSASTRRRTHRSRSLGLSLGSQLTLPIFGLLLVLGPAVMGGMRTWILLPMLALASLLLFIQGARLWSWSRHEKIFCLDTIDLSVLLFVLYATTRFYTGPSAYLGRLEWLCILAYAAVFFIARHATRDHVTGLTLIGLIVLVALGVNLFALYLSSNPSFLPYGERLHLFYAPRWTGSYGCPNHFGYLMVMAVSVTLALGFFSNLGWSLRIIMFYLAGFFAVGVGFSLSRGSWLAILTALVTFALYTAIQKNTQRGRFLLGGGCFVLIAMFALWKIPGFAERCGDIKEHFQNNTWENYVRIILAQDALKIIQAYPWWGTGPATFVHVHPHFQRPDYGSLATYTHNDYLNLACDYGLVGGLITLVFLIFVSRQLLLAWRFELLWPERVMVVSASAAWAALVVHSTVDFNLHIPANALIFFTLVGLGLRPTTQLEKTPPPGVTLPSFLAPLTALAVGFVLLFFVQKTARAYYPGLTAERLMTTKNPQAVIQAAEEGAEVDLGSAFTASVLGDYYRRSALTIKDPRTRFPIAQQAERWYRRALAAEPLDESLRVRLAMSLDLMQRYPEAYLYYQQALRQHPYNGYFWSAFAAHHFLRGQFYTAQRMYEKSLACPNGHDDAQAGLKKLSEFIPSDPGSKSPTPDPRTIP